MRFSSLLLLIALVKIASASADPEIAVAIRYLQTKGISHAHIYLYREDGRLLRQLTHDNSGQDMLPIFSPDGSMIVFTREQPNGAREIWGVDPRGRNATKLTEVPSWYLKPVSSRSFTSFDSQEVESAASHDGAPASQATPTCRTPDGKAELILREGGRDENDGYDLPGYGKHYLLRDLSSGSETELGKLPGFLGAVGILHEKGNTKSCFLCDGSLRVAFFYVHLDSTDGDTVLALDLAGRRFVRLSPNWATPIPLEGEAAFLTLTENRYTPIPGTSMTANCSYLEHWNTKLKRIRYAKEGSAALCCGASIYRSSHYPRVIVVPRNRPERENLPNE